jgi:putative phosphoribosyl transferase
MFFESRNDAAEKLLEELKKLKLSAPIVYALPRGGVALGSVIAKGLGARLDLLLTRKLGAPFNEQLALGALVEGDPPHVVINEDMCRILKIEDEYLEREKQVQLDEIRRRQSLYRGGKTRESVAGKEIVLVDDGIATGATMRAAIKGLMVEKPARLILAVPVAHVETLFDIKKEVKEVICLHSPEEFHAVAQFYRDFRQVTDDEVIKLLSKTV